MNKLVSLSLPCNISGKGLRTSDLHKICPLGKRIILIKYKCKITLHLNLSDYPVLEKWRGHYTRNNPVEEYKIPAKSEILITSQTNVSQVKVYLPCLSLAQPGPQGEDNSDKSVASYCR